MKHTLYGNAVTRSVALDGIPLDPRRSQEHWNHSPDGFNWGYNGSGPAQLALAIFLQLFDSHIGYQDFKSEVISKLPIGEDFEIGFELEAPA